MSLYAIEDVRAAFHNFSGWSYLAAKRIQLENRRTLLGTAWVVLAYALTAVGIGVLMAQLQARPMNEHVPYVMFGFAAWTFVLNSVVGGCTVMANAKPYLLQMPTPRTVFPLSMTLRNIYLLMIHLLTAVIVSLCWGWRPSIEALWVLPGLLLLTIIGFAATLFFGLICIRLRDLTRLIEAVMRFAFFFTPIIWVSGARDAHSGGLLLFLMTWNPLTYLLEIVRDGMLGAAPDPLAWQVALAVAFFGSVLALTALQLFGRRVTYWL